jgi:hypothetical protein
MSEENIIKESLIVTSKNRSNRNIYHNLIIDYSLLSSILLLYIS